MARPTLSAQPRSVAGKPVKHLRAGGLLPAVVYGRGHASEMIQLDAHEFELLRRHTGRNALVDLALDGGKATPVLLQHVQEHPLTRRPLHVDFLVVAMTEELTVEVPVHFTGIAPAVDKLGGVLLHLRDSVTIRALPDNLPASLEVDTSGLDSFDMLLHVSDLAVPTGVTIVNDGAEPLARVQPPRVEEVAEPTPEEAEAAAAEAAAEGAPTAEGGAPAGGAEQEPSE
jgi:large subunit ribosomal protein L25